MSGRTCRVRWVPGTDTLLGTCHCSAQHITEDPVDLWQWMDNHHHNPPGPPQGAEPTGWDQDLLLATNGLPT
ncbi:hypothetical protein AB0J47_41305 [Nocardia sp. NPDC049737]|uniref:hypothetical protein n=1 Tax=Nocardia sp. NPDC049737 TaxID=3154358 RepID=UPI003440C9DE